MRKFSIVTNGYKYRLQDSRGKFWEEFSMGPEGPGYYFTWETRFYLRALKKLAKLTQYSARNEVKEKWRFV
jgi:hypothetical protein